MLAPHIGNALRQYQQVDKQTVITDADPHRLIQMLMEAVQESLIKAKGHMERGEVADKGVQISRAIGCINGLRGSLKSEAGPEMAANLDALYDYMERSLVEANLKSDTDIVDEVIDLLLPVKEAWDAIGDRLEAIAPVSGATA